MGKGAGGLGQIRYRLTQGFRALSAPFSTLDIAARAETLADLPEAAATAFRALPKGDQQHALRVYRHVVECRDADADLRAAALLHDIGKHPGVGISQRIIRVLLAGRPRLLAAMTTARWLPRRWRRGLTVLIDHAEIGAERAAALGCTPATVSIIRTSHDADVLAAVRRLQAADDAS